MSSHFLSASLPPKLGRWCLSASPVYASRCDPRVKGMLADSDNSVWEAPPLRADPPSEKKEEAPPTRDAATALASAWHG